MNAKEYQFMREDLLKKTLKLSDDKRIEYTEGHHNSNVLWNFENIAKTLEVQLRCLRHHSTECFKY